MTASFMHCSKRRGFEKLLHRLCALLLVSALWPCFAQTQVEVTQFEVERYAEEVVLNAQVQFELSSSVEDALLRGIPVYFRAEAEVLRERWYWYDKSLSAVSRHYKLAYQPLTRRWRVSVSAGPSSAAGQGLALSQSYDTLAAAMSSVKKINRWRVAGPGELEPTGRYRLDFRFNLDVSQLPRPFQIGLLGQTDWDINILRSQPLLPEFSK